MGLVYPYLAPMELGLKHRYKPGISIGENYVLGKNRQFEFLEFLPLERIYLKALSIFTACFNNFVN